MTGRELICYILENHLEDEPIVKNGKFVGLLAVEEAAVKFNTGTESIRMLAINGCLDSVKIGTMRYIPVNACIVIKGSK